MTRLLLVLTLCLAACAQTPASQNWTDWTDDLVAQNKLRTDRDPADASFTAQDLIGNFARVALSAERLGRFSNSGDRRRGLVRKWLGPVPYRLVTRPGLKPRIAGPLAQTAARIARATGAPIVRAADLDDPALLHEQAFSGISVIFAEERDLRAYRQAFIDALRTDAWDADRVAGRYIHGAIGTWLEAESPCMFNALGRKRHDSRESSGVLFFGIILIRADLPELLLRTCLEEEFAQVLGLPNDNVNVRPSVFNDDHEYALLTRHDELLLSILYDARLKPGMEPHEAIPTVRRIVRDLGIAP